jgi:hypothetical protein
MVQMPDFGKVGVKWPELQAAAEKLKDLEGQRDRATRKLGELRSSKPEAEAADRKAFTDALIAGKGKPKKSEAAKLEARIAAEQERAAALDLAVSTVKRDLLRIAVGEAGAAKRDEIVARLLEGCRRLPNPLPLCRIQTSKPS